MVWIRLDGEVSLKVDDSRTREQVDVKGTSMQLYRTADANARGQPCHCAKPLEWIQKRRDAQQNAAPPLTVLYDVNPSLR